MVVVVVVVLDVLVVVLVDVVVVVGQLVGMSIQFSHVPTEHTRIIVAPTGSSTIYPAVKLAAGTCVSKGAVYPFASEYKSNGPAEPPGGIVMFICINMSYGGVVVVVVVVGVDVVVVVVVVGATVVVVVVVFSNTISTKFTHFSVACILTMVVKSGTNALEYPATRDALLTPVSKAVVKLSRFEYKSNTVASVPAVVSVSNTVMIMMGSSCY